MYCVEKNLGSCEEDSYDAVIDYCREGAEACERGSENFGVNELFLKTNQCTNQCTNQSKLIK